jgi:hypothetical protein
MNRFALHAVDGTVQLLELAGREECALSHLLGAGDHKCKPIDAPVWRWSNDMFKLRRRAVDIATLNKPHGGPYAGTQTRYVLKSTIERLSLPQVAA